MRNTTFSILTAVLIAAAAGSASAEQLLTDNQMDGVTAGADITTDQLATATADADITTNADHNVIVTANTYTSTTATITADESAVLNSTSQSRLNTSTANR